jgi:hypothetical protein
MLRSARAVNPEMTARCVPRGYRRSMYSYLDSNYWHVFIICTKYSAESTHGAKYAVLPGSRPEDTKPLFARV